MKWIKLIPLIGVAIFIYLLSRIGIRSIYSTIFKLNQYFFLALALIPILFLLQLYKWNLFLKKQDINLSFWQLFKISSIGNFYGFITPSQLGSFVRANYVKKYTSHTVAEIYPSVLIERLFDLISVFILAILGLSIVLKGELDIFIIIIILFVIAVAGTFFVLTRTGIGIVLKMAKFLTSKKIFSNIDNFVDMFYRKMFKIRDLIYPLMINIGYWLAIFSASYVVALSYNMTVPWLDYISIFAIATLIGIIPITASGLGTREAALLVMLLPYGSSAQIIISMSIMVLILYTVIPALVGAVYSLCEK
jgi:glycosyltransferase 2 family protein